MSLRKTIIMSIITLLMFFLSFILIANDYMNMVPVTFTITALLFIYMIIKVFSKNDKKSIYKRKLQNILKTYDSLLVYSKNKYDIDNNNLLKVKTINDLMKAQQIISQPVIYIDEENRSRFIIKDEEKFLVYTLEV